LYTHVMRALVQFEQPPGALSHLTFRWAHTTQEKLFCMDASGTQSGLEESDETAAIEDVISWKYEGRFLQAFQLIHQRYKQTNRHRLFKKVEAMRPGNVIHNINEYLSLQDAAGVTSSKKTDV
jgi:hypothetical protein